MMRSTVFCDGDLRAILEAIYSTKADDPSPYGAGFRRGVATVALALGLRPDFLTAYEDAPRLTIVTSQRRAMIKGER